MRSPSRGLSFVAVILVLSLPKLGVGAVAFTPGDLVVSQVGVDPTSSDNASAVNLLEFSPSAPNGTSVQTIPLPSSASGNEHALTLPGSGFRDGMLTLSTNGQVLTIGGYDAPVGTASVAATLSSSVGRTIGVIDSNGNVDTTTAITDAYGDGSGAEFRSVASTDGRNFWTTGNANSSSNSETRYVAYGATTSTRLHATSSVKNTRVANIFNNQIYFSSNSGSKGIVKLGTGTPMSGNSNSLSLLTGTAPGSSASPYDFVMFDTNNDGTPDLLYLADDRTITADASSGGIEKFVLSGSTWVLQYVLNAGLPSTGSNSGIRGLTGRLDGNGNAVLYGITATGNGQDVDQNYLVGISDVIANTTLPSTTFTTLQTAAPGEIFRGVDFAPTPEPTTLALIAAGSFLCAPRRRRQAG